MISPGLVLGLKSWGFWRGLDYLTFKNLITPSSVRHVEFCNERVYLSVYPYAYLRNHMTKLHQCFSMHVIYSCGLVLLWLQCDFRYFWFYTTALFWLELRDFHKLIRCTIHDSNLHIHWTKTTTLCPQKVHNISRHASHCKVLLFV